MYMYVWSKINILKVHQLNDKITGRRRLQCTLIQAIYWSKADRIYIGYVLGYKIIVPCAH